LQHAIRLLGGSERLGALLGEVAASRALLLRLRRELPPPLSEHCLHAGLADRVLTLVADSSAWGSRLRFFAPELVKSLQEDYGPIESTRIRIQPPVRPGSSDPRASPASMSPGTVQLLRDAADGLGDTDLGRALRRLAAAGAERR
jgi:hypothetical protein